jgi:hypothetical protein
MFYTQIIKELARLWNKDKKLEMSNLVNGFSGTD